MYKETDGQVVETAREARGGYLDRPILVVLAISTGLALVAMAALWMFGT